MYRPITYLCAKLTQELTLAILSSLIFCCVIFWAMELPGSFGLFFITYYQTTCIGIGDIFGPSVTCTAAPLSRACILPALNYCTICISIGDIS